jgi:LysM repeat protein
MAWAKKFTIVVVIIIAICSAQPAPITSAQGDGGTTHIVQSGENLFRIALLYNTTVDAIAVANGITDPTRVYAGQVLVIPAPGTVTTAPVEPTPVTETAYIPPLDTTVPVVAVSNTTPAYHTVQAGETLASIGRLYGLSWTDIATANNIVNANTIYVGQQLTIPGTSGTVAAAPAVTTDPAPAVVQPVATGTEQTHTVQAGESLASIGRIYGISWPTIAQANNITDPNHIYSGQVLTIPASDLGQGGYTQTNTWTPTTAASPTISTGKQIVVDLSDQMTYAYENGQLLRSVVVSTGLWYAPTVQGDYNIYIKYTSQTMSGPGYYLPGVPYVMYFYQGYSLHGTYWHSNFGQPMSHGCVNMPTPEAEWFYNWSEVGTPVHVQW